jgi:hypothetical protein
MTWLNLTESIHGKVLFYRHTDSTTHSPNCNRFRSNIEGIAGV